MTITEFLTKLSHSRSKERVEVKKWFLQNNSSRYCPITYLCKTTTGRKYSCDDYMMAGREIGLRKRNILSIVNAADTELPKYNKLRIRLMSALGVKE